MAQIIDGKSIAASERELLVERIEKLKAMGVIPGLCVILVGEDPASLTYVSSKEKMAHALNMKGIIHRLPAETSQQELIKQIELLNADDSIHGILVQLPLPPHLDADAVAESIRPEKDVDGLHPLNAGRLLAGRSCMIPCTPNGCMELIRSTGVSISGKNAVIIGRSNIVGKPIALLLMHEHATATICHSRTKELTKIASQADILVCAIGRPGMIKKDMIKPGAVVIDVGINRVNGKLYGDVEFNEAKEIAGYITPVPGGVGPMTIMMLMRNTVEAAEKQNMNE